MPARVLGRVLGLLLVLEATNAEESCRFTCQQERRRASAAMGKTRRKPAVATTFNFLPEGQQRSTRDTTLTVLDLFGYKEEEGPVLMPMGGHEPSAPRGSRVLADQGGLAAGNMVEEYLKANSQVNCAAATLPLKRRARQVRTTRRPRMWIARYSSHCHGQTGQFRYPDNCHAYVDCWRGRGTLQHCNPRSLVFNEDTGQCDWPQSTPCVEGTVEEEEEDREPRAREIDLTLPNCADYTALGYKCVDFWECSEEGNILANPYDFHSGEGLIDARILFNPASRSANMSRDPLTKACPGQSEICCRGKCAAPKKAPSKEPRSAGAAASRLCPSGFTGLRAIPGVCTMFAECHQGRAYVKDCPPGTQFCTKGNICDFPSKISCDQLVVANTAPTTPGDTMSGDQPPVRHSGVQPPRRRPAGPKRRRPGVVDTPYHIPSFSELYSGSGAVTTTFPIQGLLQLARSTSELEAPPAGQTARLRRGKAPSEGYLQLYRNNRWGYACDSGTWGVEEAKVVCRQLGFTRGVMKTTQGLVHGKVAGRKATDSISCSGAEDRLEDCTMEGPGGAGACSLEEDIVSVTCVPDSWATCEVGELPWAASCYSFHPAAKDFNTAVSECRNQGKKLLEIETQEENDMLSELLYSSSRVTGLMNQVWTGGVGSSIARKNVWFWHDNTDRVMEFQNWWKGWSGGDRVDRSSIQIYGSRAISLSRAFPLNRTQSTKQLTDYYFWQLEDFSKELPFICEKSQLAIGCIEGSGEEYRGPAARTKTGVECGPWDSPEIGEWFDQEQLARLGPLQGNNKCRNPDDEAQPWCLLGFGDYDVCDIPQCQVARQEEHPGPALPKPCDADQFACRSGKCIFGAYICDGEADCEEGEDESPIAECDTFSDQFTRTPNRRLVDEEVEQWSNRNLEACLKQCVYAKGFTCRGVNYDPKERQCVLLENNIGLLGSLEETFNWHYFERRETEVTCASEVSCRSGKCLNATQFCNGVFDCPDKRDEDVGMEGRSCGQGSQVEVRLVGGQEASEGRVEVRGMGHGWGGICDDGFGMQEATVICKAAGFHLGAKKALQVSEFGATADGRINLDELDCKGNEASLMDCKFNPWTEHDCSVKEFAGVVCLDESRACEQEEWRCSSGECRNLNRLCDTVEDCQDGSDEEAERCDQELAVRLVGGNNVTSGRVEVRHHGQWGTVCDDEFGKEEGRVVCRMLGFPGGVRVHMEAAYGEGSGPVWVRAMECSGNETSLRHCPAASWEPNYYCQHREDVGVECLLTETDGGIGGRNSLPLEGSGTEVQCGVAEVQFKPTAPVAKVAGGQTASQGSQPWTASIRVRGNSRSFHWCGAVLVGRHHLLTAAHCVEDYPKETYLARVGDWDQDVSDIDEQEFSIQSVHFHPEFNVGAYLNNDIAVVKLKRGAGGEGVQMSRYVAPACLPAPSTGYRPGMECTISGWGSINQGSGGYSRRMQAAIVPILATQQCMQKHVYGPDKLTGGMFCAGYLAGGVDSCQGDSGGPMVCRVRNRETLLGVISWGYGCGRANKPGVYTKVAHYIDWLEGVMGDSP